MKKTDRSKPDWPTAVLVIVFLAFTSFLFTSTILPAIIHVNGKHDFPDFHFGGSTQGVIASSAPVPQAAQQPLAPLSLPDGSAMIVNPHAAVTIVRSTVNGIPLVLVEGGTVGTRRSPIRQGVADFVRDAGATAGLNGTFFQNASLTGTNNTLIGPSLCANEPDTLDSPDDTKPVLTGRPMVLISPDRTCLVPYDVTTMDAPGALRGLLPGLSDAFLGGVWLVHGGTACSKTEEALYGVKDAEDYRRRAFFAVMPDGRPVLGATDGVTCSSKLAKALAAAGIDEAVLLDSGFSTSLVFGDKILVTGHTAPGIPSRPVPHAVVLYGQPANPAGGEATASSAARGSGAA